LVQGVTVPCLFLLPTYYTLSLHRDMHLPHLPCGLCLFLPACPAGRLDAPLLLRFALRVAPADYLLPSGVVNTGPHYLLTWSIGSPFCRARAFCDFGRRDQAWLPLPHPCRYSILLPLAAGAALCRLRVVLAVLRQPASCPFSYHVALKAVRHAFIYRLRRTCAVRRGGNAGCRRTVSYPLGETCSG